MYMIKLDMKKVITLVVAFLIALSLVPSAAFASHCSTGFRHDPTDTSEPIRCIPSGTIIDIEKPNVGYSNIGTFITAAIQLAFVIAIIVALAMLIWGAVQWIFSGGEKEAVDKARTRITNALIGLAILAVAFAIITLAGQFLGIDLFNLIIPTPERPTPFGTRQ